MFPTSTSHPDLLVQTVLAILPLIAIICAGIVARRAKLLQRSDSLTLNTFAVKIALPSLVLSALATRHFVAVDFLLPTLLWFAEVVIVGLILVIGRTAKFDRKTISSCILATFGNTGFIGYPVTSALIPEELPGAVFIDNFGTGLILFPTAVFLASYSSSKTTSTDSVLKQIGVALKTPVLVAIVTGLIVRWLFMQFPDFRVFRGSILAIHTMELIGAATIPVVLTAIGLRLSAGQTRQHLPMVALIGLLKLILMPGLVFLFGVYLYHLSGDLLAVAVLEASMPPSASGTVLSEQYGLNGGLAVAAFFVLTLTSAVTIPVIMTVLR